MNPRLSSNQMGPGMESSGLLDLFRERVDYTVEAPRDIFDGLNPANHLHGMYKTR